MWTFITADVTNGLETTFMDKTHLVLKPKTF